MTLLALHNVDAGYASAHILHDVSIEVAEGERVAILGRNGVGKTTLVNTCFGIATLYRGSIELGGQTMKTIKYFSAARRGVALVPQDRRIVPGLTIVENLLLGAAVRREGPWNIDTIFDLFPTLKRERRDILGTTLSGGQQQMLAIGRALMANPGLLVLDEPSEGLAPVIVDGLAETLRQLAATGTSILLIEQNLSLIQRVAERYYVMSKGAVIDSGIVSRLSIDRMKEHVAV